jgi:hypothetical protein
VSDFRSEPEELRRVLAELHSTREALQDLSTKVAAMERHLRRVFSLPRPAQRKRATRLPSAPDLAERTPFEHFDRIRLQYEKDPSAAETLLKDLGEGQLRALARDIGVSASQKTSNTKLRAAILLKVRESVMLGSNVLRGVGRTDELRE